MADNTGKRAAKPHRLGGKLEASVCIWHSLYLPPSLALAVSFPWASCPVQAAYML